MSFYKWTPNKLKAAAGDFAAGGTQPADHAALLPALDVADGLGRVMNNMKLYCRLLAKFPGPEIAHEISAAIQAGDQSKTAQSAHALKGVCANLGLGELKNVSRHIEMRAKEAQATADLLPALEQALTAAATAIESLLASEED